MLWKYLTYSCPSQAKSGSQTAAKSSELKGKRLFYEPWFKVPYIKLVRLEVAKNSHAQYLSFLVYKPRSVKSAPKSAECATKKQIGQNSPKFHTQTASEIVHYIGWKTIWRKHEKQIKLTNVSTPTRRTPVFSSQQQRNLSTVGTWSPIFQVCKNIQR